MSLSLPTLKIRSAWAVFIFAALCLFASAVSPATSWADPKFPALSGRVVDQANLLTPEVEADLTAKLKGLEDATTDQVVVVTLNSLDGYEIADYGYQLGRHWGIGQKAAQTGVPEASEAQGQFKNNGVILIVAPNERKVRIEVGYGLEPVLTDAYSSLIIQNGIIPSFRTGDYQAGIVNGTDLIIAQLAQDRGVAIQKAQAAAEPAQHGKPQRIPIWLVVVVILFLLIFGRGWLPFLLLDALFRGGGGGGWSGGGGGGFGGGFSGGGGGFGGGGSSGSW